MNPHTSKTSAADDSDPWSADLDALDDAPHEPLDEATVRRVMNRLRAKGAFDMPARVVSSPTVRRPGPPAPAGMGLQAARGAFWPLAASAALGLALALLWGGAGVPVAAPTEDTWTKSLPGLAQPEVQPLSVADPAGEAERLAAVLAQAGLRAQTWSAQGDWWLQAVLPSHAPEVAALVQGYGLLLPEDGRLVVRFSSLGR